MFFLARGIARLVVWSFFREITVLNAERIPAYGPVIFVGNHNNQFVDASMLLAMLPRHVRFLIAEKSLSRAVIGHLARVAGCIAVARPQDKTYYGLGLIRWVEGTLTVEGVGTRFLLDIHSGDRIQTAGENSISFMVKEVVSDSEILVTVALPAMPGITCGSMSDLTTEASPETREKANETSSLPLLSSLSTLPPGLVSSSVAFMVFPRVDQTDVYDAVSDSLIHGDSIGIFPEGGSHDRTELLPLKPGVAIMALRAAMEGAEDVMVVPIGLNYYQADKILSRSTVQVGRPLVVSEDLVQLYTVDRRAAVSHLLSEIEENLKRCVISAPEYSSLKAVRLCVSLYAPESMSIPSDKYHMLYYQFSLMFNKHNTEPQLVEFTKDIGEYATLLKKYGIADHEVRQLKQTVEGAIFSFFELLFIFLVAVIVGLPLALLWGPIRGVSSYLAEKHRRKALAESKVKITGRDVVASYKILTMMVLVPAFNLIYSLIFALFYANSLLGALFYLVAGLIGLPFLYYYSIRQFAKIVPLLRKVRFILLVLVCKLNVWRDTEREIISRRMHMQLKTRELVQTLGPETHATFMEEMERCVPEVVNSADTKRIKRRLENGEYVPMCGYTLLDCREEIL